ncbi:MULTISPECIES: glycoside hydrolase family 127 protein [unclassified Roseateles]|uniref:glycoside hydrolase family 127 protein n=1 Tax=unclassified Roseateles TaxID=2626991 RepID=UPI0006F75F9B|nr:MULTISPECIES: glycoside hydrolase family 127 protein [unclassified Roseateles]KQW45334.1 glycosyl hydrolase [Pelomonas sp. Root405]KRA72178.1 glycosyl hydrolase [Pelomonas sp. Root662]
MKKLLVALTLALCAHGAHAATQLFPLDRVRLQDGPFFAAQATNLQYLMALDADRLLAPFLREAGLVPKSPSYANWESSGLDGHMGGHYVSALALMWASTGDAEVKKRLDYVIAELKRCQDALGNGYIGGIPDGAKAWSEVAKGDLKVDSFAVNGRWVPWYNIHKVFAGLRDAWVHAGSADAKVMLVRLSDWALRLTTPLTDAQMQDMLRAEHGGMNEVLADVADMTGDLRYLALARRFSHQAILQPLASQQDKLTGLHANTQIPKVIGFARIAQISGEDEGRQAAEFFWRTVVEKRSVAIGGNSVKEHFHPADDFKPMLNEVEGPETCNSYNMLKLTALLQQAAPGQGRYADYYERTLYNHILASQHPQGGFVYFTPVRPQHYRVYSQVHEGMWCCVGSGIESHARHGEFIYAHDGDALHVNLFVASTLDWRERGVKLTQSTRFPDESRTRLTVDGAGSFALKIRYPGWVAPGALKVRLNGKPVAVKARPGGHVELRRDWKAGDQVDVELPMRTTLEPMPALKNYVAVLHGPIVLAAKTPQPGEKLDFRADGSRMGHIAHGAVCPQDSAPVFVSDKADFMRRFKPVPGQPLTFVAPGLIQGGRGAEDLQLIPFFRLHDSRYMLYWARSTPAQQSLLRLELAKAEEARLALDAQTIDQVAPGEQQPESDHGFKGEGAESGIAPAGRWRHAKQWFSYVLNDREAQARTLRLTLASSDAGRRFDVIVNGQLLAELVLAAETAPLYSRDIALPDELVRAAGGKLEVRFVAKPGSLAGGLYGLRLLR